MDEAELSKLTIGALLDRQADRFGDRDCIAFADRNVRFNYRQFRDRVDLVARGLMGLGVRKAEHVAVWAPNIPEWLLLQYATAKIGAILVPISTTCSRVEDLEFVLHNSETTTLLFSTGASGVDYLATVRAMLPDVDTAPVGHGRFERLPRLSRLLFIGRERLGGMLRFDDLFDLAAQTHPDDYRRRGEALSSYEVINLQYTSGATGAPKGVMLAHRNIALNGWHVTGRLGFTENDKLCIALPLAHAFGSNAASLGCVTRGSCMVPVDAFDPRAVLAAVETERCTAICASPSMFAATLADPDFSSFSLSSLRTGVVATAPQPDGLMRSIMAGFGAPEMTVAYGLTEASGAVTQSLPADPPEVRMRTVGRALPGVQLKTADPKSGDPSQPGVAGELCCRGHGVMKGYFKDPHATAAAIDGDGWLHTRDVATIDREGVVTIVGRLGELTVSDSRTKTARD